MRLLADESCDFAVVRALTAAGHDVRTVAEERPAITDDEVVAWAVQDDRIVIAEDKDFGYLVHVTGTPTVGVVLLRYSARSRAEMPAQVCDAIRELGERLRGAFVVLQPGRVRITPGRILPWNSEGSVHDRRSAIDCRCGCSRRNGRRRQSPYPSRLLWSQIVHLIPIHLDEQARTVLVRTAEVMASG